MGLNEVCPLRELVLLVGYWLLVQATLCQLAVAFSSSVKDNLMQSSQFQGRQLCNAAPQEKR